MKNCSMFFLLIFFCLIGITNASAEETISLSTNAIQTISNGMTVTNENRTQYSSSDRNYGFNWEYVSSYTSGDSFSFFKFTSGDYITLDNTKIKKYILKRNFATVDVNHVPEMTVYPNVIHMYLNGQVDNLQMLGEKLNINGSYTIGNINVSAGFHRLATTNRVNNVTLSDGATLFISRNVPNNINIPPDTKVEQVISNFHEVKHAIQFINGQPYQAPSSSKSINLSTDLGISNAKCYRYSSDDLVHLKINEDEQGFCTSVDLEAKKVGTGHFFAIDGKYSDSFYRFLIKGEVKSDGVIHIQDILKTLKPQVLNRDDNHIYLSSKDVRITANGMYEYRINLQDHIVGGNAQDVLTYNVGASGGDEQPFVETIGNQTIITFKPTESIINVWLEARNKDNIWEYKWLELHPPINLSRMFRLSINRTVVLNEFIGVSPYVIWENPQQTSFALKQNDDGYYFVGKGTPATENVTLSVMSNYSRISKQLQLTLTDTGEVSVKENINGRLQTIQEVIPFTGGVKKISLSNYGLTEVGRVEYTSEDIFSPSLWGEPDDIGYIKSLHIYADEPTDAYGKKIKIFAKKDNIINTYFYRLRILVSGDVVLIEDK